MELVVVPTDPCCFLFSDKRLAGLPTSVVDKVMKDRISIFLLKIVGVQYRRIIINNLLLCWFRIRKLKRVKSRG